MRQPCFLPDNRQQPVFRFAPSPTGFLHLGHALSALMNAEAAIRSGGRLLLRIEDIDSTRCRPHYVAALIEDLEWLGIHFEHPPRKQSEHPADFRQALGTLELRGLVYRSYATRAQIRMFAGHNSPCDPEGTPLYPRSSLAAMDDPDAHPPDANYALRLDMARAIRQVPQLEWQENSQLFGGIPSCVRAEPSLWGDVIVARKEFPASYHIAVVVDDALQGVTHVIRGHDLFAATAIHRLLQALLGLPAPVYHHHRLIQGDDGEKLSKSLRAKSLRSMRAEGAKPADIRAMLGLAPDYGKNAPDARLRQD